jgi:integrase/recombinase XerD
LSSDLFDDKERLMTSHDRLTLEEVLAAFDEHLRRVRGVSPGTRRNYGKYVGEFLMAVFDDRGVAFAEVRSPEVAAFVGELSGRYQPRTVGHAATALRVFLRFLRTQGWCEDRLADAVPMVPHRPSGLVRYLDPRVLEQLIASLEAASARDLRDRAIILMIARVGLRPGEVAQLRLEDVDWRNAAVRVRARKTGHGALLPLTSEVGAALADYLQHGRPDTDAREVVVLHWLRVGAPISTSIVGRAVQRAVDNAGIDAPVRGGNLLRHSLATELLAAGASLSEIADVLGHSCLATTRIYAAVDIGRLREVALPWSQAGAES